LSVKDNVKAVEGSAGEVAVHMINRTLTEATDQVLDRMTIEELAEQASRSGNLSQSMYYI
jgi:hypothetical protein